MDTRITSRKPPPQRAGLAALPTFDGANDPRPEDATAGERLVEGLPVALALSVGLPVAIVALFVSGLKLARLLPAWPW